MRRRGENQMRQPDPARLAELDRESLLEEMEACLDAMTDLTYDQAVIDLYLEELERREPLAPPDTEASLAAFRAAHGMPPPEAKPQAPPPSRRARHLGRRLAVAAAAAVLAVVLTLQAAGFPLLKRLTDWGSALLPGVSGGEVVDPTAPGPAVEAPDPALAERYPYRYRLYESLSGFQAVHGIDAALEPAEGTAGFSFLHLEAAYALREIAATALYSDGERELRLTVRHSLSQEAPVVEAPAGEVYLAGGVEHHLLEDPDGSRTAWWVQGHTAASLTGPVTREELTALLDSIYETPGDS